MKCRSFLLGLGVGIVSGLITREFVAKKATVSPERALSNAKYLFKQLGPISGSWIYMKSEPYEKQSLSYDVFKGGISRIVDEELEQYEFIADAHTGTIIETIKL